MPRLGCSSETRVSACLYDASFERLREVEALSDPTARWHWSPDGTGLVLVTWEGILRLETTGWTVVAEHSERYLDAPHAAFSRDGSRFAYASSRYQGVGQSNRNLLVILDGESLELLGEVDLGERWPNGLAWIPGAAQVVLHRDLERPPPEPAAAELAVIDIETGETVATHPVSRRGYGPVALAWSPDGATLAVGGSRDRTEERPYVPLLVAADALSPPGHASAE